MVLGSLFLLGVSSPWDIYKVADEKVFTQVVAEGHTKLVFAGVVCTAWFQDQFCHLGMIDHTLLRYASSPKAGWMSAFGMFPGHLILWIAAGFLYAADQEIQKEGAGDTSFLPGPVAFKLASYPGLFTILFASWSTANPFLYAGGLAFQ